ncbi:LON peptidase substrate-binding domain-containing protein [Ideonella sp.]|uniref:LON peptidase substrate-binding domain-containing protein n=1 Tax=Ideonella sp. TaxID=1929293 RepID=UPI003BB59C1E
MSERPDTRLTDLPLFPLQTVLFPGGRLALKVFEARYLDLMSRCMREGRPFGVVCIKQGSEVQSGPGAAGAAAPLQLESTGTLAHLLDVDADSPGLLKVLCSGGQRFALPQPCVQQGQLWVAPVAELLAPDPKLPPGEAFDATVQALDRALAALQAREPATAMLPDERLLDDAGWVANRWCELLPISLSVKTQLMALPDPLARLGLIDGFLRSKKVI